MTTQQKLDLLKPIGSYSTHVTEDGTHQVHFYSDDLEGESTGTGATLDEAVNDLLDTLDMTPLE
jgi:hypothetical protein